MDRLRRVIALQVDGVACEERQHLVRDFHEGVRGAADHDFSSDLLGRCFEPEGLVDRIVVLSTFGFVLPDLFAVGLRCAIRAKSPEGMKMFVDLAVEVGLVPDIPAAHLFYSVALRTDSLAPNAAVLLRRLRAHAGENAEIDSWIADLDE